MHSQLALTEHALLNLAPLILLDPVLLSYLIYLNRDRFILWNIERKVFPNRFLVITIQYFQRRLEGNLVKQNIKMTRHYCNQVGFSYIGVAELK